MKHSWMSAVAVATLTAGLVAANAQSPAEQKRLDPQAQDQGQSQTPDRSSEQPSAKRESGAAQDRRGVKSGSEAKGGAAGAQKSGTAQKEEGQNTGTAQKDDESPNTRSNQRGSQQERKTTQTPDRNSKEPGERAGSEQRKDRGTAQSRERDNERAGKRDSDGDRADRRGRDGDRDRSADDRDGDRDRMTGDRRGDRVQFSERERTTIQNSIRREKVERTNINVNISVGATIPRNVTLRPLPAAIVQINPAYRSYRYVVVRDEIVIINPQTYRVVEVLPYSGSSNVRARRGGGTRSVELSTDQRRRIVTYAREECDTVLAQPDFQINIGTRIPERIQLCPFEEVVIQEVDVVRPYRFFLVGDEVVLVDPSDHTIVEVIR